MRIYFNFALLILSTNALAIDNYNSLTGVLEMDGVVHNGTQYNNLTVQVPAFSVLSEGSRGVSYPTPGICKSGNVPSTWNLPQTSYQLSNPPVIPTPPMNDITLVLFRHGEKALETTGAQAGQSIPENGNMSSVGQTRAQLLPARLNSLFGCPDYTIAPNPAGLINGYNYVRPAATIEPTATTLNFPLWMPYGASNPQWLAKDLLTDPAFAPSSSGQAKTAFIAWEHNNIVLMTNYITNSNPAIPISVPQGYTLQPNPGITGMIVDPPSQTVTLNGAVYNCQPLPTTAWAECDYDSIWVLNIRNGNHVCYVHLNENLDNQQYQKNCR